ncbi:MAG: TetR/AcrR family transcriptional regulator [Spirochaetia bacterium]|nr:TetR/AcrR family transcriptional regulator [Spirochaetia bacterium]
MSKAQINQETKLKILFSAKKEFALHGFAGARMDAIAKQTGVNKAMLHYYFGSKEQLYKDVIIYLVGLGLKNDTSIYPINESLTSTQKLSSMIYCIVHLHFDVIDHDFHRIIAWDFAEGKNSMKMLVKDYFGPALERLESIVIEGVKTGEFKTSNPMMSVWSFIVFLITYINQEEIYRETKIYNRLYGNDIKQNILDFLFVHVFQSLGVANPVKLKDIPLGVIEILNKQILEIKNNRNLNL